MDTVEYPWLMFGDCLDRMREIPDDSVDMILCDLPYGTTDCQWDKVIPFEPLWEQYWRVLKKNRAVLLFGSEPFSTSLRLSSFKNYRYDWYWDKKFGGNFVNAKIMPLKTIECISVFSQEKCPRYFPQMLTRDCPIKQGGTKKAEAIPINNNSATHSGKIYDKKYPITLLQYKKELGRTKHPTQKPVDLLEYLIKTYTNEGEVVLDNTMGSGSTGVASVNTDRKFIGIEKDEKYFEAAKIRIESLIAERLF